MASLGCVVLLAACGSHRSVLGVSGDQPAGCKESVHNAALTDYDCATPSKALAVSVVGPLFDRLCTQVATVPLTLGSGTVGGQPTSPVSVSKDSDGLVASAEYASPGGTFQADQHLDGRAPYLRLQCLSGGGYVALSQAQVARGPSIVPVDTIAPSALLSALSSGRIGSLDPADGASAGQPTAQTSYADTDGLTAPQVGAVQFPLQVAGGSFTGAFEEYDSDEDAQAAYEAAAANEHAVVNSGVVPATSFHPLDLSPTVPPTSSTYGFEGFCLLPATDYGTDCKVVMHSTVISITGDAALALTPAQDVATGLLSYVLGVDAALQDGTRSVPPTTAAPTTSPAATPTTTAAAAQTGCPAPGASPEAALTAGVRGVLNAWRTEDFSAVDRCVQAGPGAEPLFAGQPYVAPTTTVCTQTGQTLADTGALEWDCIARTASGGLIVRVAYGILGNADYIADVSFISSKPYAGT